MNHLPKVVLFLSLQIAANGVEYGRKFSNLARLLDSQARSYLVHHL